MFARFSENGKVALVAIVTVIGMLLATVACTPSNVTTTLEVVITAAEAAVGVLGAAGTIPPATMTSIDNYLTAVSQATSYAATELASTDSSAVKADKIVAQFAAIAAPVLPPGIAQTVVAVIQSVANAVGNFLSTLQPATSVSISKASVPSSIKVSGTDKKMLGQIKVRADALILKISVGKLKSGR